MTFQFPIVFLFRICNWNSSNYLPILSPVSYLIRNIIVLPLSKEAMLDEEMRSGARLELITPEILVQWTMGQSIYIYSLTSYLMVRN